MFEITVRLPVGLTAPGSAHDLALTATTVREAVDQVLAREPGLATRILFEGRPLVSFVLNGRQLRPSEALRTGLANGDRLDFVPPVAGG